MREPTTADIIELVFGKPLSTAALAIASAPSDSLVEFEKALRWLYGVQPCGCHREQSRAAIQMSSPLLVIPTADQIRGEIFKRDRPLLFNLLAYFPSVHLIDSIQGQFFTSASHGRSDIVAFSENVSSLKPLMDSGALMIRGPCNLLREDFGVLRASAIELGEIDAFRADMKAQIQGASQETNITLSLMMNAYTIYGIVSPSTDAESPLERPDMRLAHVLWQLWTSARMNCSWACEDLVSAAITRRLAELVASVAGDRPAAALHTLNITVPDQSRLSPSDVLEFRGLPAIREWHSVLGELFGNDQLGEFQNVDEGASKLQDKVRMGDPTVTFSIFVFEQGCDWLRDPSILAEARIRRLSASLRFFDLTLEDPAAVSSYPRRRMWVATTRE